MRRVLSTVMLSGFVAASAIGCGSERDKPRTTTNGSPVPACPSGGVSVDRRVTLRPGIRALAANDLEVWAANPRTRTVTRVDARSGRADAPFRLGSAPTDVAVGLGSAWTISRASGSVLRIDPATRAVRELAGAGVPVAIEMTRSGPWVLSLDDGSLYGFDGKGNLTTYDLSLPVIAPGAMVVIGDELAILGYGDKFLIPVNFELRRIVRDPTRLGISSVAAMTSGAGFVWLADTVDRRMLGFEPRGRTVVAARMPRSVRPVAIAVGRCGWAIDAKGRLARFDPATARFFGTAVRVARSGGEMVADATGVWMTDPVAGQLLHVRALAR